MTRKHLSAWSRASIRLDRQQARLDVGLLGSNHLVAGLLVGILVDQLDARIAVHLADLYAFYGELTGVRIARKHISWYTKGLAGSCAFRHRMNQLGTTGEQLAAIDAFFDAQAARDDRLVYSEEVEELAA